MAEFTLIQKLSVCFLWIAFSDPRKRAEKKKSQMAIDFKKNEEAEALFDD